VFAKTFTKSELLTALTVLDSIEVGKKKYSHWQRDLFAQIRGEIYEELRNAPDTRDELPF